MSKYDVSRFRNVTVALNTPFTKSGEVDLAAARRLTRYYINKGIKSLYVCGSTGEGFLLDSRERMAVVEAVKEEAGEEMAVIVHVAVLTPGMRRSWQGMRRRPARMQPARCPAFTIIWARKAYTATGRQLRKPPTCPFSFITYRS